MEREQIYRITNSGKIIPVGELVRCKDCKNGKQTINAKGEVMVDCMMGDNWLKYPDWFCADGERR